VTTASVGGGAGAAVRVRNTNGANVSGILPTLPAYVVAFRESGLPPGAAWSVNLSGARSTEVGTAVEFAEPNGTYPYTVGSATGYLATPAAGSADVNGTDLVVSVAFSAPAGSYPVTFSETGLPLGTNWSVEIGATAQSTTTTVMVFAEANGSLLYAIHTDSIYEAIPSSGSIVMNGAPIRVAVSFTTQPSYLVTFLETGLPLGPNGTLPAWQVTLAPGAEGSESGGTSLADLWFNLPNATYEYTASTVSRSDYSAPAGSFTVAGVAQLLAVDFSEPTYPVTFQENDLPNGTGWSVTLGHLARSSTSPAISFEETNGTYNYSVGVVAGWSTSSYRGTIMVDGGGQTEILHWARARYPVEFSESGLPTGTNWSVTFGGATRSATVPYLTFGPVPNGSYSYTVGSIPGFGAAPLQGSLTVGGQPVSQAIAFAAPPPVATFLGLPPMEGYAVLGGSTAAVVVAAALVIFLTHRKKGGPETP
jgi:hypothetical protein